MLCYGDSWVHGFQEWRKADREANGPDDLRQHQREDEASRVGGRVQEGLRGLDAEAESSWNSGALGVLDSAMIGGRSSPRNRKDERERTQGPMAGGLRGTASERVREESGGCRSMQWSEEDWRDVGTQEDNPFAMQGSQGGEVVSEVDSGRSFTDSEGERLRPQVQARYARQGTDLMGPGGHDSWWNPQQGLSSAAGNYAGDDEGDPEPDLLHERLGSLVRPGENEPGELPTT